MAAYLTRASTVQCAHGGSLYFPGDSDCNFMVGGSEILRSKTLLAATISGCSWKGDWKVPCTNVIAIQSGKADEFDVDGDMPILESLRFTTNGNGPPGCSVVSNSNSNAETLGGDQITEAPAKNWSVKNLSWSFTPAREGDVVTLKATATGVPDGTQVIARIYEQRSRGPHEYVARIDTGQVSGGTIRMNWPYEYHADVEDIETHEEAQQRGGSYTHPEYFFELRLLGRTFGTAAESGILRFRDYFEMQVVDDATGEPLKDLTFRVTLPDGDVREVTSDPQGYCRIADVAPGRCSVVLKQDDVRG